MAMADPVADRGSTSSIDQKTASKPAQRRGWSLGMLHADTEEVPGTVMMIEGLKENVPLGIATPANHSTTSVPSSFYNHHGSMPPQTPRPEKKKTSDGIILHPQPEESPNDPLNWPKWRRDVALLSLGFFCMLGGGMTPILAAGFSNVAETFDVSLPRVALTTGLYMMGLGLGSVIASPTAILYGKRPVYLFGAILFILTSIWCAQSNSFPSLLVARIFMGIAVSPVECLPSASIAEIFFLHERAYRLGVYTLLLLGGKNLIPLVSAAIINSLGWRWVFYIVAIVVGFGGVLLFLFVPESFWDRTPTRKSKSRSVSRRASHAVMKETETMTEKEYATHDNAKQVSFGPKDLSIDVEKSQTLAGPNMTAERGVSAASPGLTEAGVPTPSYTQRFSNAPPKSFVQTLRPYAGRLSKDNWFKVAFRPFVLFAYPAILWSSLVYALSVGWLIVLSESVSVIYKESSYGFSSLQAGLVYLSPFVGGVLGTAVAGKVSDFIVRYMARRNEGIYEPEFRLIMAIPVAISTTIGLMGYGWSAQVQDSFWVPTIFFGVISFGCCAGSTTAITFAVDSYRQYAGEALVTLNFSKNILHGLVFSLFFNEWLESSGSRTVFLSLGGIQLFFLLFTIPMYIYGKRARMWTVKMNFMDRF